MNDFLDDGDVAYTVQRRRATSTDPKYQGLTGSVSATNTGRRHRGVSRSCRPAGLVTTEAGGTATFQLSLTSQPNADVHDHALEQRHHRGHGLARERHLHGGELERGADGDGHRRRTTSWPTATSPTPSQRPATSTDAGYGGQHRDGLACTNTDNDTAGLTADAVVGPGDDRGGRHGDVPAHARRRSRPPTWWSRSRAATRPRAPSRPRA